MSRLKFKLCCYALALFVGHLHAASVDAVRGALLFHLSKVVTFPQPDSDAVYLCVYPQSTGIIGFFKQKGDLQSQGKPFQLRELSNDEQPTAARCQMLYLEWPLQDSLKPHLPFLSNQIMTISHDPEFLLSDGLVTLTTLDSKMVIMMNKNSLKKSTVTFPSRVLKLAIWYP